MAFHKLIPILGFFFLVACSDNTQTSQNTTTSDVKTVEIDPSTFSENKKKFIDATCSAGNLSLESCACMYDSMNPKLSEKFGKDWMSQGMQDLDLWTNEINKAMPRCGIEFKQ